MNEDSEDYKKMTRSQIASEISVTTLAKCDKVSLEHYYELNMSTSQIATRIGIGTTGIKACLKLYGPYFSHGSIYAETKAKIWEKYLYEKMTPSELADYFRVTEWTILTIIEENSREVIQNPNKFAIEVPERPFATYNYLQKAYIDEKQSLKNIAAVLELPPAEVRNLLVNFGLMDPIPVEKPGPRTYPYIDTDGYNVIQVDGKAIREHLHVWIQAHGPIPKGMHIHHIDWDKLHNVLSNLDMVTSRQHAQIHAAYIKEAKQSQTIDVHKRIISEVKAKSEEEYTADKLKKEEWNKAWEEKQQEALKQYRENKKQMEETTCLEQ